jgi:Fur family transcriptional regulator, ferric uptake regulator
MSCNIKLKENGYKLTPQRRIILDIIHETGTHLTGEEIYTRVKSRVTGVNKSTIYRTLELLENLGCVYKSEIDDRFVYHHADEGHHHHIVCRKCNATIECDDTLFDSVEHDLLKKYSFQVDFKHIVMSGLCRDCLVKR